MAGYVSRPVARDTILAWPVTLKRWLGVARAGHLERQVEQRLGVHGGNEVSHLDCEVGLLECDP